MSLTQKRVENIIKRFIKSMRINNNIFRHKNMKHPKYLFKI